MMTVTVTNYSVMIAFWLVFSRILAISIQLPIFDNQSVPNLVKVLMAVVLSYAFFPQVEAQVVGEVMKYGEDNFWALTIFHTIAGLLIGYFVKVIMSLFIASGSIMTQQMGFSSMSYFDPTYDVRVGPFEQLIQWGLLITILSTGALIPMFKGMISSFHTINPTDFSILSQTPDFFLQMFKGMFQSSFLLATPILFTNLLLNLVMGIVSRTIPQMNIMMISFIVNIGVGLLVFYSISEEYFHVAYNMYTDALADWFQFIL